MKKENRVKVRKRRKQLFVDRFGGKCSICGYDKCINSLDFHHIDPNKKEYPPSYLMNLSIENAQKELEKCILVCKNCHGEIHSENYDFNIDVTKYIRKWNEIECGFCHTKFLTMNDDRKFCSDTCSQLSQMKVKNRPDKKELKNLIEKYNWTELGRMYNVSDNAIRKWARKYGLLV